MRAHVRPNVEIIAAIERGKQRALEEKRRSDIEKANHIYAAMVTANLEAETVAIAAFKRFFNIGEKRMKAFLPYLKEVKKEFEEYRKDGIFSYKVNEEFGAINVDIINEMMEEDNLAIAINAYKGASAPDVTMEEASEMQEYFKGIKKYMNG